MNTLDKIKDGAVNAKEVYDRNVSERAKDGVTSVMGAVTGVSTLCLLQLLGVIALSPLFFAMAWVGAAAIGAAAFMIHSQIVKRNQWGSFPVVDPISNREDCTKNWRDSVDSPEERRQADKNSSGIISGNWI